MWDTYDVDRSGALDREETKNFVRYTLLDMGADESFDDVAFEHVFNHFDKDGSGTVDKEEMLAFVKRNFLPEALGGSAGQDSADCGGVQSDLMKLKQSSRSGPLLN